MPPPRAPSPKRQIFDPWNSASTGHQRAENRLSGSTSWRSSRTRKLQEQFSGGIASGGGDRMYDTVGAGSRDFGKDGRLDTGAWDKSVRGSRAKRGIARDEWGDIAGWVIRGKEKKAVERSCIGKESGSRLHQSDESGEEGPKVKRIKIDEDEEAICVQDRERWRKRWEAAPTPPPAAEEALDSDEEWDVDLDVAGTEAAVGTNGTWTLHSERIEAHEAFDSDEEWDTGSHGPGVVEAEETGNTPSVEPTSLPRTKHKPPIDTKARPLTTTPPSHQPQPPTPSQITPSPALRRSKRQASSQGTPVQATDPEPMSQDVSTLLRLPARPIFDSLTFYILGSTHPLISDHALRHLLISHGGGLSIAYAKKTVSHILVGSGESGGGSLAGGKLQKEIARVRGVSGAGVRFVRVGWVLDCIRKGKRIGEAGYAVNADASKGDTGGGKGVGVVGAGAGQRSVLSMFSARKKSK